MNREALWKSLMRDGSVVMFWRHSIVETKVEQLDAEGFDFYRFECESWDRQKCLREIGITLEFPDYYGNNLEALNDCLSDIVPKHEGIVFIFKNFDKFYERDKSTALHVLDIIQTNSWRLLVEEQKKLIVFLHSSDPQLRIEPVGAFPVAWNNEEWLDSSRK